MRPSRLRVGLVCAFALLAAHVAPAAEPASAKVADLSLLVSPEYPCYWPVGGLTFYSRIERQRIPASPFNRDMILIDEHTGTQWDAPAHFVPPPDSGLPNAGPMGLVTSEKVPIWQFFGEACVIDVRDHVDDAPAGSSFLITPAIVQAWEQNHRPLGPGDVVLFRSDYNDRYYQKYPAGDRFVATALANKTPGWPAPSPDCMKYLGERKVTAAGIDSPSMGPLPNLAAATHLAGGQYGLIWAECLTNLGSLPTTGAFYGLLAAKHAGGSGGEARAIGITDEKLAARLLKSAREKRVADLTVLLDENLPVTWPGDKPGTEGTRYLGKTLNKFDETYGPYFARTHQLDSHAGTHLVPPAFSLPPDGFDNSRYDAETRGVLAKYESKFGPRGHSSVTAEKVPLEQMQGPAHMIDVRQLAGTTNEKNWPASPIIALAAIDEHEKRVRPIRAGEVVIFYTGYTEKHFQPFPAGKRHLADPLAGKAEGWPALDPAVIVRLAEKGVRCIATDAPTFGGVQTDHALQLYWSAASRGVVLVEQLTNVGSLADKEAYFIFAPVRLAGCHGGYGRAVVLY